MNVFVEVGLWNALTASLLAGAVFLVTRLIGPGPLARCLWLLVLIKLIAPPLVSVPVFQQPAGPMPSETQEPIAFDATTVVVTSNEALTIDPAPAQPPSSLLESWSPLEVIALLWTFGSICWLTLVGIRIARFSRMIRHALPAPPALQRQADHLAARFGLRRRPSVRLVDARLPPMLWATCLGATILVPRRLVDRLSDEQMATLLAHELAHLSRRDHWVRWLEMFVLGLFWWHPVAWYARRAIQQSEEHCCDAYVVWALPEVARPYANALMATLDFLSPSRQALPPAACGVGQLHLLKRRFEMILCKGMQRKMSWSVRLAVLVASVMVMPLVPRVLSADDATTWKPARPTAVEEIMPRVARRRLLRRRREATPVAEQPAKYYLVECRLEETTKVGKSVLYSPTILTIERRRAFIAVTKEIPVSTGVNTFDENGQPKERSGVIVLDEGITIDVTVLGTRDSEVTLDLSVELSNVDIKNMKTRTSARIGSQRVRIVGAKPLGKPFSVTIRKSGNAHDFYTATFTVSRVGKRGTPLEQMKQILKPTDAKTATGAKSRSRR